MALFYGGPELRLAEILHMAYAQRTIHTLYKKLLRLYPREFREQLGESMQQTFNDLCAERETKGGWFGFMLWTFIETAVGIVREHVLLLTKGATMKNVLANPSSVVMKWGGLAYFLLAVTFIVAPLIYFMGNLRDAMGPLSYDLADFLYGPVWSASLVTAVFILRERLGEYAPRRMSLALLAALLAAGATVAVACIRASNRHYHLIHPELHLETDSTVLVVWTTLVAGMSATAWHFLGWALVLIGSAGWTSRRLPRLLSVLYFVAGTSSLFVYLLPSSEGNAAVFGVMVSIWQGILLWKGQPGETKAPGINASQPHQI
jgi:hypothetical protein